MKRSVRSLVTSITLFCLVALLSWQYASILDQPIAIHSNLLATTTGGEPVEPIPLAVALDSGQMALGRELFHDTRLSANNTISCASCHDLNKGGTDQSIGPTGINGQRGEINVPTILNSGFQFKQFWDGRAENMQEQTADTINAPNKMGSNFQEIISKLESEPEYVSVFKQQYPDGITEVNIKDAIAEFGRSLYTPNASFDKFLRGDQNALTADEKEGYRLFKTSGCVACHQGILLGGNMFQRFGVFGDYFQDRGNITKADYGRFNVTGREEDRFCFKVPMLRNVALTFPYFHDGSAKTLHEAVKVMVRYQLGRQVSQQDIDLVVNFLMTLTGEFEGDVS